MTFSETALHILRTVAPTLADAALGPFGPLAAAAIHAALGTDPADPKAAETAILAATPDQLLALKKADQDFEIQIEKLGIEKAKLSFDDTANARGREIAVKDNTPKILSYVTTFGFFGSLAAAIYFPIPKESSALVFSMIGSLGTVWITQQGYYFGSSRGSDDKSKVIADIAKSP